MLPLMLGMDTMVEDMDTEDITVDTMATLTDTDTTEARGLPHLKPKPKLPLMPGMDTTVWDTVDTTDTVWDTTDTDTVWDTVDTTDTGMAEDTMVDTTDTVMDTDTDTTVKNYFRM